MLLFLRERDLAPKKKTKNTVVSLGILYLHQKIDDSRTEMKPIYIVSDRSFQT